MSGKWSKLVYNAGGGKSLINQNIFQVIRDSNFSFSLLSSPHPPQNNLKEVLLKEKREKIIIIVTHDENIALQADRIITIADGRIARDERQVVQI